MQLAFAEDKALGSLDLSTWDNSATASMKDAFLQMDSLNEISLGSKFKFVGTNGYLPTPSSTYIAGADGKWYDTDGNGYVPADIPSNKAMTYTAVAPEKAFAVYSADDGSLSFYKRSSVPTVGDTFEGKAATEVYEGVEEASYTAADGAPWAGHAADIASVTVADEGIAPVSTAYWFKGASKLKSVSLAGLDTSQTTCMDGMFDGCSSLETLDLSNMSTRRVASMTAFLGGCDSLAELSLGSEFAWVDDDCYPPTGDWKQGSTGTKYAENQIPANKTDKYTRAKTAFAVYSADDQSLTFYKRFEAASEGAQFLGKTATKVFTGFETKAYFSARSVPWSAYKSDVKTVTVADEGIAPRSTERWFSDMAALGSADMLKLDTSNVVRMGFMFDSCGSLTSLDLSSFDTHNVMRVDGMFYGCESLTSLDLSSFETGKVVNMDGMFIDCRSLTTLDLSSFDTGKVTSMYIMFSGCESLTSLNVSSFDTSSVTSMSGMFNGCTALTNVDLSSFDTGKVTDMSSMFMGCKALTTLDFSSFDTRNVTNMRDMFWRCAALTTLDLSTFDTSSVTSMSGMFNGCSALQKAAFGAGWKWAGTDGYLPTPSSTYIAGADGKWYDTDGNGYAPADIPSNKAMTYTAVAPKKAFAVYSADDQSLTFYRRPVVPAKGSQFLGKTATRVFTGFETKSYGDSSSSVPWSAYRGNVKTVSVADEGIAPISTAYWFYRFTNATLIDLARLDTGGVTDMSWMFNDCKALTSLDVSSFDTHSVTSMVSMFDGCGSLTSLDVSHFDTANVTDMYGVFYNCGSLTSLDVSSFDTANVTNMRNMFASCKALTSLDVSSFDTRSITSMRCMFSNCGSLTSLDVSHFDTANVTDMFFMFSNCGSLTTLDVSSFDTRDVTNMNGMFGGCGSLTSLDISSFDTHNVSNMASMFMDCKALTTLDISSFDTANVTSMGYMFSGCSKLSADCSNWNVSKVTDHSYFNRNAPGVTAPLAWQVSSDEGVEDSTIAPLCEEQGNGNMLSVPSESDYVEAASKTDGEPSADSKTENDATTSAEDESTTQNDVEGVPSLEEKASKESGMTTESDGAEKAAVKKSGE